jgi:prophage antirepressor-like protein
MKSNLNSNLVAHSFYEYMTGESVRVYIDEYNQSWFMAKDVAEILDYSNTRKAIIDHVDEEDRIQLKSSGVTNSDASKSQAHSILINESGLYSLILRSNKKEAKEFKRWITKDVLPKLRNNGKYEIPDVNRPVKTRLEVLDISSRILSLGGLEERDMLLLKDLARNATINSKNNELEIINTNEEWSLSRRLDEKFDLRGAKINKQLINFGKQVVKKYKEIHEQLPPKRSQFVAGTVRQINCYFENDYEEFIDDMIKEYFLEV